MFKVGFMQGQAVDPLRETWCGTGPRPLNWSAWYPTDDPQREQEIDPDTDEGGWMAMGPVVRGARLPPDAGVLPVVLTSHGTGGTARGFGWLGRRLAAQGFLVLGVDHHGNTRAEPYQAEGFLCWWERARDLTAVLDHMSEVRPFSRHLDMNRVFAAGFSLGGYTVVSLAGAITDMTAFAAWVALRPTPIGGPREFPDLSAHVEPLFERSRVFRASWERQSRSYGDPRIRAVLSCAPAPPVRAFTTESLKGVIRPVGIVVGGADTEAPPEDCACWLDEQLPNSRLVLLGPSVGHAVFLCEGTALGRAADPVAFVDPKGVHRRAIHDEVASFALRLFRV